MRSKASRRDRQEREARARRARAEAHLARVRGHRNGRDVAPPGSPSWRATAGIAIAALAGGVWLGDPVLGVAAEAWSGEPRRIEVIAVRGSAQLSPRDVADATGLGRAAAWEPSVAAQVVDALEDHDWIARADAVALPGGTLAIEIEERQPVALLALDSVTYAVDASGTPFAPLAADPDAALPLLRSAGSVTPREPHPRLAAAIRVVERFTHNGLAPPLEVAVSADDDPEGLVLQLPGLGARFVLGKQDLDARVDSLAKLLSQRPAEVSRAGRVDLRFEGQAVLQDGADPKRSARAAAPHGSARAPRGGPRG